MYARARCSKKICLRTFDHNFVVLQDEQEHEDPHLQDDPQQDLDVLESFVAVLATGLEEQAEFLPHIIR